MGQPNDHQENGVDALFSNIIVAHSSAYTFTSVLLSSFCIAIVKASQMFNNG